MIQEAKDLSPDQKTAIESILGRSIADDEAVVVRALGPETAPEWLRKSWESARQFGLDQLSAEEIDAEIRAARMARGDRGQSSER
jgi:hypothetical protein